MQETRLIKKYPNRRLYDTELSLYITLEDLKSYVLQFIPFKVIDAKTEIDVTRASLIQILLELEGGHSPFFTQTTLEQLVRLYGSDHHTLIKQFLETSFDSLKGWQELWKRPSM